MKMKTFNIALYSRDFITALATAIFIFLQQTVLTLNEAFFLGAIMIVIMAGGAYLQYWRDQNVIQAVKDRADSEVEFRTEINRLAGLFEDSMAANQKQAQRIADLENKLSRTRENPNS